MPKAPHTPSKSKQAGPVISPYFKAEVINSPYFRGASSNSSPVNVEDDAESSDEEEAGDDELSPYNTYWDAVVRAAHTRPKLIQEEVAQDWWKVLIAAMLLNKTTGKAAIPAFRDLMTRWPDPASMAEAPTSLLGELLRPLGLYNIRAQRIVELSAQYIADPPSIDRPRKSRVPGSGYPPTAVSHLPGCGRYALDSFRIFCCPGDEWRFVMPTDKELIKYLRWKWAIVGCRKWDPVLGVLGYDDEEYLDSLCVPFSQT